MKYFAFLMACLALAVSSCADVKGVPIEMSKACDIANDGKVFEIKGVIADDGSVFCSNIGSSEVQCGFKLLESVGSDKSLKIDVVQGTGANSVTKLESGYKKEDIKIRDNAGNQIALNTDVVRATGKVSVAPAAPGGQGVCFMQVAKIER